MAGYIQHNRSAASHDEFFSRIEYDTVAEDYRVEYLTKLTLITVVVVGITTIVGTALLTLTDYNNTALLDPKFFVWLLFGFVVVMLSASAHERDSEDSESRSRNE